MPISTLAERQARQRQLTVLREPALWPRWPFLPVVRRTADGPQLGLLVDARRLLGLYGYSATGSTRPIGRPRSAPCCPSPARSSTPPRRSTPPAGGWTESARPFLTRRTVPMLTLPRNAALRFRLMLRRAVMLDAYRQTWPVVVCRTGRGELTLEAGQGGFAVRLAVDAPTGHGAIAFRGDLLTKVEGRDDTPVTLEPAGPGRAVARWADGGVPQAAEFETVPPEDAPAFPAEPPLTAMPESFLAAFADAIRTAAKQHVRAGLTRVLFRGKGGEIVASDSKQLLVQRGYPFPWEGDVLVPRLPALDGRPLDATGPVGIGRTAEQVIIRVAPWAFAVPVDAVNPFPAIDAVIPRATAATGRLRLDPGEASRLEAVLPRLPGAGGDQAPVTVALDRRVAVRARGVKL
jgi:hypothetical protein